MRGLTLDMKFGLGVYLWNQGLGSSSELHVENEIYSQSLQGSGSSL